MVFFVRIPEKSLRNLLLLSYFLHIFYNTKMMEFLLHRKICYPKLTLASVIFWKNFSKKSAMNH